MDTTKTQFEAIRQLIRDKKYDQARAWLRTLDTPLAADWLKKLDQIAPEPPSKPAVVVSSSNPRQGIPVIAFAAFALIATVFIIGAFLVGRSSAPQTQTVVIAAPTQPTPDVTQAMVALQMTLGAGNQIRQSTVAAIETVNQNIAEKLTATATVAITNTPSITRTPRNTSTPRPTSTPSLTFTPLPPLPAKLTKDTYFPLSSKCAEPGKYVPTFTYTSYDTKDFSFVGKMANLEIAERCSAMEGFQLAWYFYSDFNSSLSRPIMDKTRAWGDFLIGWEDGANAVIDATSTRSAYLTAQPTEIEATKTR